MTTPARLKQADVARVLREARKLGPIKNIRILPDGTVDIVLLGEADEQPSEGEPIIEPPASPRPKYCKAPLGFRAHDVVRHYLKRGPTSAGALRTQLVDHGFSEGTLNSVLARLKDEIETVARGVYALKPPGLQ